MEGKGLFANGERVYRSDQNQDDSDNFGLPETGSSSSGGASPKPAPGRYNPEPDPEDRSSGLTTILIILFICVIAFLGYWFLIRKPKPKENIVARDTTAVQVDTLVKSEPVKIDSVPAQPAVGEISTIKEKTGRYYIVVSSSVDGDLANDYATKLSAKGIACKIIPPATEKKGFYKLSVADFETFNEANSKVEELKGTYGNEIRVLKY
jgi:hypothetical protein